jgi:aminoglycoside phosphotransferase (APT) family kinase protein
MAPPERSPSAGALEQVLALAGPAARIDSITLLAGGTHAATWRVGTATPAFTVVVREFPVGDPAGERETEVLQALGGLGGLAPVLLGSDLDGRWAECPTTLISWLDGEADILPTDRDAWASQLGQTLAVLHALPREELSALPSLFADRGGSPDLLAGPLATRVRSAWSQITTSPEVLTHGDYWSGNVVWRDGLLSGVVDWSGVTRGPRGFDVGWCRLDLYLLFDEQVADVFLTAYEDVAGPLGDIALWDSWAAARSNENVETWAPNYQPLGRADLGEQELRRRHSEWTALLQGRP